MISGQETEWVYSYNPGADMGLRGLYKLVYHAKALKEQASINLIKAL